MGPRRVGGNGESARRDLEGPERRSSRPDLLPGPGIRGGSAGTERGQATSPLCLSSRASVAFDLCELVPRLPWGRVCRWLWGFLYTRSLVQSRGPQTAILLALRPYSHSAQHPHPMPREQPMQSPPPQASQAQREGPAPQGRATWGGSPALHLGPRRSQPPLSQGCCQQDYQLLWDFA